MDHRLRLGYRLVDLEVQQNLARMGKIPALISNIAILGFRV